MSELLTLEWAMQYIQVDKDLLNVQWCNKLRTKKFALELHSVS